MPRLLFLLIPLLLIACGDMEKEVGERGYYEQYFSQEIKQLTATNKGILKHTTTEDEVEQWSCETMSREMWKSELRGFLNAPEVLTNDTANYIISNDSSGIYQVVRYTAKDTMASLLKWEITMVNGELEMINWETQTRSVLLDRNVELNYQPQKGYRIQIIEDPMWGNPKMTEVFAEFTN